MTLSRQGRRTAFSLSCNTEATNPWRCHCFPRKENRMDNIKRKEKNFTSKKKKKKKKKKNLKGGSEQNEKKDLPNTPFRQRTTRGLCHSLLWGIPQH